MNRIDWLKNKRFRIDWHAHFEKHGKIANFYPRDVRTLLEWQAKGYRLIRKITQIEPKNPIPVGTVFIWSGEHCPEGFEEMPMPEEVDRGDVF
jgi:hypothetical protein